MRLAMAMVLVSEGRRTGGAVEGAGEWDGVVGPVVVWGEAVEDVGLEDEEIVVRDERGRWSVSARLSTRALNVSGMLVLDWSPEY